MSVVGMTTSSSLDRSCPDSSSCAECPPQSRIALWCATRPWLVVLVSCVVVAVGVAAMSLGMKLMTNTEQLVGDSKVASQIREGADFGEVPTETIVVSAAEPLAQADVVRDGSAIAKEYSVLPEVTAVKGPMPGQDGKSFFLFVELAAHKNQEGGLPHPKTVVPAVLATTKSVNEAFAQYQVGQIGDASMAVESSKSMKDDFTRAEFTAIPVTLLILLVAFGSLAAAGVPVLLGMSAVGAAMGVTTLLSHQVLPMHGITQSFILLIGLAVGVDYALFIIRRAREERALGRSTVEAIGVAGHFAGHSVVVSGVTVIVSFAGLLIAGGLFTSIAVGGMVVVALAMVMAMTTLPAVLALAGDRIESLRVPGLKRNRSTSKRWAGLARRVTGRPWLTGGATVVVLAGLAVPALTMNTTLSYMDTLPQDLQVVSAAKQLKSAAPAQVTSLQVVVKAPADQAEAVAVAVNKVASGLTVQQVTDVGTPVKQSTDQTVTLKELGLSISAADDQLHEVVRAVRAELGPGLKQELPGVPGVQVAVGSVAASSDLTVWLEQRLPWVIAAVVALTFVVVLVCFKSVWLAAATVLLNGLSVGAAFGVMALVFENTWAEGLLDFTSMGAIVAWVPLVMFVTLFGLSMDYHIFVTSRVREARAAGASARESIVRGVGSSAGVVTSAAAVMVGVFAIFGSLSSLEMKQIGVGLATAIFLDATVIRGVLLPALFQVLGDRIHPVAVRELPEPRG